MSVKQHVVVARATRMALLGVATATVTATVVAGTASDPVPSPVTPLAQSHRSVGLAAAASPFQPLLDVIDTVFPAVVDTVGAPPTITLSGLLSLVPPELLTDVLNANAGPVNVISLLDSLGLTTAGSSLNATVSNAIASVLNGFLTSATTGAGAEALMSQLSSAIASAVASALNAVDITVDVPVLGETTIDLASILGNAGLTDLANDVGNAVAGQIVTRLPGILPTPSDLAGTITAALPDLLNTFLSAADLTDANGNIRFGNLVDLVGFNLSGFTDANALTVTSAGPLFTLARLIGGVDLGWVPGTGTSIGNSVNTTGYLHLNTSTLKTNLADALSGALSDGTLAADLGTALTPALNTIANQIVDNAMATLETDLADILNGALGDLTYSVEVFGQTIDIPVGALAQSAIAPLISDLASELNSTLSDNVSQVVDEAISTATESFSDELSDAVNGAIDLIPTAGIASIRIPVVIGTGFGALSADAAYRDLLAELSSQPGGTDDTDINPLAGSLTILPQFLLNNVGRANGGVLARFSSLLNLLGIGAVTPDLSIASSGGEPLGDTGLSFGGANLLPVKVDATVEYQLQSDFAAWPNAVTLLNNLAAAALPTYMFRGLDTTGVFDQLIAQVQSSVTELIDGQAANTNIYLTAAANTLPLLEPLYLLADVIELVGIQPVATVVENLANALSPALTSLVNLGYSDAYWNADTGTYERTLNAAATPVQFGALPDIDWLQVVPNILGRFAGNLTTAFTEDSSVPNVISSLIALISGALGGAGGNAVSGPTGAPNSQSEASSAAEPVAASADAATPTVHAAKVPGTTEAARPVAEADEPATAPATQPSARKAPTPTAPSQPTRTAKSRPEPTAAEETTDVADTEAANSTQAPMSTGDPDSTNEVATTREDATRADKDTNESEPSDERVNKKDNSVSQSQASAA